MLFSNNDIRKRYSFELYPAAVIGTSFRNVMYLGTVDASGVTTFDPQIEHTIVYPYLPTKPARYDAYVYHRFQLDNGKIAFVGDPWIKESTLKSLDNVRIVVTYEGEISGADEAAIRLMNANNGYPNAKIEVIAK